MAEKLPASDRDEVMVIARLAACKVDHGVGIGVVEFGLKSRG